MCVHGRAYVYVSECVCVCVCVCMCICKQLIGKYLPTRRVVVSGGWGNGSRPATAYKFVT